MDIAAISAFLKVAETRSFVEAGRLLAISASGIGKSIVRLEERLGVRLFHRSTRSVTLTAEGEIFLERARRIVSEFSFAEAELSQSFAIPRGRLKIGLPLITEPFLPVLVEFKLAHPNLDLEIEFDNRTVDLIEGGYDCVIRSGKLIDSQLSARCLGLYSAVIVGTPAYFARNGTPQHPSDLGHHTCIHLRNRQTGKLIEWSMHAQGVKTDIDAPTSVVCNTNEAQIQFALGGVGIAYVWDLQIERELRSGELVTALDEFLTERSAFHLLWPSGRNVSSKLRAFIEFMMAHSPLKGAERHSDPTAASL